MKQGMIGLVILSALLANGVEINQVPEPSPGPTDPLPKPSPPIPKPSPPSPGPTVPGPAVPK
jgi:hypothetical protein